MQKHVGSPKRIATSNNRRFTVLIPENNSWANDNITTYVQWNNDERKAFGPDTELGASVAGKDQWTIISLNGTTYWMQTVELGSAYTFSWWAPHLWRNNGSDGNAWGNSWGNGSSLNLENNSNWPNRVWNTVRLSGDTGSGFSGTQMGLYFKASLYTGSSHETVNNYLVGAANYYPGEPEYITGKRFVGWYTDAACSSGKEYTSSTLSGDIVLYAKYEDISTFQSGEVYYLAPNNDWLSNNARFAVNVCNGTTNEWVDATEYGLDASGNKVYKVVLPGENQRWNNIIFCRMDPSASDNNWENKWNQTSDLEKSSNNLVTITDWNNSETWSSVFCIEYDGNGNDGGSAPSNRVITVESSLTIASNTYSKSNYAFSGWNTTANISGTAYSASQEGVSLGGSVGSTITLFAKWTQSVDLNKNATAAVDGAITTITAIYNAAMPSISAANLPKNDGYQFIGFYDHQSGGNKYYNADGTSARLWDKTSSSPVLYAHWSPKSYNLIGSSAHGNVTFYSDSARTKNITSADYGSTVYYSVTADTGYTAPENGSFTLVNGTSGLSFADITTANTDATLTLSACTANTYTVTLNKNANDATAGTASVTATYGSAMPSAAMPTRSGYAFEGFYTSNDDGETLATKYYDSNGASARAWGIADDTTLYANWVIWTFTLQYDVNGGNVTAPSSSTQNAGDVTTASYSGTKTGYTFGGWEAYLGDSGTSFATIANGGSHNFTTAELKANGATVTLKAIWNLENYTITYSNMDGAGNNASNPTTYNIETATITLADPTTPKTGYSFVEWYTDSELTTAGNTIPKGSTGDKTFYAKWTANEYSVTFNRNWTSDDSNEVDGSPINETYDAEYTLPSNPSRTGYAFAGWWTDRSGGDEITTNTVVAITAVQTLYAHWTANTYTVTLNKNADDATAGTASVTATYDAAMPSATMPTRTGYTFEGYYDTNASSGGNQYYTSAGASARTWNKASATILYARWSPNGFTVAYNANTGTETTAPTSLTYDATGSLRANGFTAPTGYHFKEWNTMSNGSGTAYATSASLTAAQVNELYPGSKGGTKTLFAIWEINSYTVTIVSNNVAFGTVSVSQIPNVPHGATVSISTATITLSGTSSVATPTEDDERYDYSFSSWSVANNAAITDNTTITATFTQSKQKYTLTWNFDGGSTTDTSYTVYGTYEWGTTIAYPDPITKTGYDFVSWSSSLTEMPTQDLTITASWTPKILTITLNGQGADGAGTTSIYLKYGDGYYLDSSCTQAMSTSANPIATLPTRTGYTFGGFYTETGGSGVQYINASGNLTSSASLTQFSADGLLYAKWTGITYYIEFDPNGGTGSMSIQTRVYGSTNTPLTANTFSRSNYLFSHWNTERDGSGTSYNNEDLFTDKPELTTTDGDTVKLYARWKENKIYFVPTSVNEVGNEVGNAWFALHVYDASGHKAWATFEKTSYLLDGSAIYMTTIPSGYTWTKLIFCRMNPAYSTPSWDSGHVWNRSGFDDPQNNDKDWDITMADLSGNLIYYNQNSCKSGWGASDILQYDYLDGSSTSTYYYFDNKGIFGSKSGTEKTPYAHYWVNSLLDVNGNNGKQFSTIWPGVAMTSVTEAIPNKTNVPIQYVWSITIDSRFDRIIFDKGQGANMNNAGDQTTNLVLGNGSSQGRPSYFFVLTGSPISAGQTDAGKYNGEWHDVIYPFKIKAIYFDGNTAISDTPNTVYSGYTFGTEPVSISSPTYSSLYHYESTIGALYKYTAGTDYYFAYSNGAFTNQFTNDGNHPLEQDAQNEFVLYVKFSKDTTLTYTSFYVDFARVGDSDWTNYQTVYFHVFDTTPTAITTWGDGTVYTKKVSDHLGKITLPVGYQFIVYSGFKAENPGASKNSAQTSDSSYLSVSTSNTFLSIDSGLDTYSWRNYTWCTEKDYSSYGTATIYKNNEAIGTMGIGDISTRLFVYEKGVDLSADDTLKVVISGATGDNASRNGTYAFGKMGSGYPWYITSGGTDTSYYLEGEGSFATTSWTAEGGVRLITNPNPGNQNEPDKGVVYSLSFVAGDTFKIYDSNAETWYGYDKLVKTDGQYANFEGSNDGNNNLVVKIAGTYDVYLNYSGMIYIGSATTPSSDEILIKSRTTARVNLYLNSDNKLYLADVPVLGNGFYIMEGTTGTGFAGGVKMSTSSTGAASYSHFKAKADTSYFIRSYIDAVDRNYNVITYGDIEARDAIETAVTPGTGLNPSIVFTFKTTLTNSVFDIHVSSEGTITISVDSSDKSSFFRLPDLEIDSFAKSVAEQKTYLVVRVDFTIDNRDDMTFSADIVATNDFLSKAGAAFIVTNSLLEDPFTYMSTYRPTSSLGSANATITPAVSFTCQGGPDVSTLYAYFIFDYVIDTENIPTTTINTNSDFTIYLNATQVASTSSSSEVSQGQ